MTERKEFEEWYVCNAFDYERDPVGSRDCGLQWAAWQAGQERLRAELEDAYAEIRKQVVCSKVVFDRELVNRAKLAGVTI